MKSILGLAAAACLLVGLTAERASADIVYDLSDATFKKGNADAGTLTGSFTMNSNLTEVIAANIVASGAYLNPGTQFTIAEYVIPGLTQAEVTKNGSELTVKFTNGGNGQERLELVFATGLATTGSTALDTDKSSLEHQNGAGNRFLVTGYVTAQSSPPTVPEPSTIAVVAVCAPALLVYAQRRRQGAGAA